MLPAENYCGPQGPDPDSVGITAGTHTAAIMFPGEKHPKRCYVKFLGPDGNGVYPHDVTNSFVVRRLLNEVSAYTLAHHLKIRQPPRAAVILIEKSIFIANKWPLPPWADTESHVALWCTEEETARNITYIYKTDALLEWAYQNMFKEVTNWYGSVSAFDEWVANNDRNGGNILKISDKVFSIIDHGRAFFNLPYSCVNSPGSHYRNIMLEVIESSKSAKDSSTLYSSMLFSADKHDDAFNKSYKELAAWADIIGNADFGSIIEFLRERSQVGWMRNRLGMVI